MDLYLNHTGVLPDATYRISEKVRSIMPSQKADVTTSPLLPGYTVDLCFYWSQCPPSVIQGLRHREDIHSNTNGHVFTYLLIVGFFF